MTAYPLRALEAELHKTLVETSTERDARGMYIWRGDDGEPYFWSLTPERYVFQGVTTLGEADQIMFLCPLCFEKNGGAVGTHSVMVSFAGRDVPDEACSHDANGKPSRWTIAGGASLDDLVLTPSILLGAKSPPEQGCHWHGFVGSSGIPPGHAG